MHNQVQDEDYKNFDSSQASYGQFKYSSADQFQQQAKESAKPLSNIQQTTTYSPIPLLVNFDQQSSIPPPLLNSEQQQQNFEQNIVKSNSGEILIKDLNFVKQSQQALQSLLLLTLQQICLFFALFFIFGYFDRTITDESSYFLFLYIPLHLILLFLSNTKYFRAFPISLALYFINVLFTSLILFYFCALFKSKKDGYPVSDHETAIMCCVFIIPINVIQIILIMIYLCIEQSHFQFIIIIPILCAINFFLFLWLQIYQIVLPSFLYGILLLNAISQSFKGRFLLKPGKILNTANSYNFGIIVPFQIFNF